MAIFPNFSNKVQQQRSRFQKLKTTLAHLISEVRHVIPCDAESGRGRLGTILWRRGNGLHLAGSTCPSCLRDPSVQRVLWVLWVCALLILTCRYPLLLLTIAVYLDTLTQGPIPPTLLSGSFPCRWFLESAKVLLLQPPSVFLFL